MEYFIAIVLAGMILAFVYWKLITTNTTIPANAEVAVSEEDADTYVERHSWSS